MDINTYREELRLKLTGGVLELELSDSAIDAILNSSLRELRRYIDTTKLVTAPFSRCIHMSDLQDVDGSPVKVSSVSRIYRSDGIGEFNSNNSSLSDPMFASQWQLLSGPGNMYNMQNYIYNYMSYNTLLQIRNTSSTDFSFFYNHQEDNLYINVATTSPQKVTIEYVPRYDSVEDIKSDYWIDMLMRLAVAQAKVAVGHIRSRYTQSNALWQQDGNQMLQEGTLELNDIREHLKQNATLLYPID